MKFSFNKEQFIRKYITGRNENLTTHDIEVNYHHFVNAIKGKAILVIGGAGTIGSAYIKSILPFEPRSITVVDYNENGLTELVRDLRSTPHLPVPSSFITYPFDFGSPLLAKLLSSHSFDVIASFAAHKHVRSEKDIIAVEAMIQNNVFNTWNLLNLAKSHNIDSVFAVSTDKASNPVNVMGGSKKLMENILLSFSDQLQVTTARFANVAFSNGSLLDGFMHRMALGQPLAAPNDVKRYFVTPSESGAICMLASLLGDSSDIFFPKLAEDSMKTFSEIADQFLYELGLTPEICASENEAKEKTATRSPLSSTYPVFYFQSETTGEKSFEEFFTKEEILDLGSFKSLGIVKHSKIPSMQTIQSQLESFKKMFAQKETKKEDVIGLMKEIIPEFDHQETGKNLDTKM
jgi:FlaA1/EpsC-like NDP-sugar epimerase